MAATVEQLLWSRRSAAAAAAISTELFSQLSCGCVGPVVAVVVVSFAAAVPISVVAVVAIYQ